MNNKQLGTIVLSIGLVGMSLILVLLDTLITTNTTFPILINLSIILYGIYLLCKGYIEYIEAELKK